MNFVFMENNLADVEPGMVYILINPRDWGHWMKVKGIFVMCFNKIMSGIRRDTK